MAVTGSYYINGIGIISPQKTFEPEQFLTEVATYHQNVLTCVTPDFKSYINPVQLRRLSRMLRIGLTSSILCLRDASVSIPNGIITSTGYGFLEETEKFLREILVRNENQLTPTYFMQGTYNALAGLVALSLKCTGYNNTYVSKGFAFENALDDAMFQLIERPELQILVGAYDEAANVQYMAGLREGHFKKESVDNLELFNTHTSGTIQGEGAAFFLLSGEQSPSTWCSVVSMRIAYKPTAEELRESIISFLNENNTAVKDIDAWISGAAGDEERDKVLNHTERELLSDVIQIRFKHLCGEYCTASSFALWLGAAILKKQIVPDPVRVQPSQVPKQMETILIVNHYLGRNCAFFLLKRNHGK